MKMKSLFKWLCLGLFVGLGVFAIFAAPDAVESFLPTVSTVTMEKADYCKTVSGVGNISTLNDEWYTVVAINEADIRKVEVGQQATLSGAAFESSDHYIAEVIAIAREARKQTNGYTVETIVDVTLKILNPDDFLRQGYTAQANIRIGEDREVLLVPYSVICQDDDGEYVYVLSANKVVRHNIITGAELQNGAELLAGLRETDEIITAPEQVSENSLVKKEEFSE